MSSPGSARTSPPQGADRKPEAPPVARPNPAPSGRSVFLDAAASGGWKRERLPFRRRELRMGFKEVAQLAPDLATACRAVLPLMCVDAQGRVGLAMAEPPLDLDDRDVERDEHARMAVAEIMQRRRGAGDACLANGPLERLAGDLPFNAAAVATREDKRLGVCVGSALAGEGDESPHQLRWNVDRAA